MIFVKVTYLIVTDMDVIRRATCCDVVKYMGIKASHMIQVVYMENPINLDSLKASGIFRVSTAYTVQIITRSIG